MSKVDITDSKLKGQLVPAGEPLLSVRNLTVEFEGRRESLFAPQRMLRAVHEIAFDIAAGESIGIVGESGCGKSTIARVLVGLQRPTDGSVFFRGEEIDFDEPRSVQSQVQMVFQDPYSSLNPRLKIWNQVSEPLRGHKGVKDRRALRESAAVALEHVGLDAAETLDRFPHQFSGGQRQRIAIARALVLEPAMLIADEPMSSLDVSSQSHIADVLRTVCSQHNIALLLISHDLPGVHALTERTFVIYLGRIVEAGPTNDVLRRPAHPYTQALIAAAPRLSVGEEKNVVTGDVPSPYDPPEGCVFHPRCPIAESRCREIEPDKKGVAIDHWAACHLVDSE